MSEAGLAGVPRRGRRRRLGRPPRRRDGGLPCRRRWTRPPAWPQSIAAVPEVARTSGALLTIADRRLTVRLTRDLWQLEPRARRARTGGLGGRPRHRRARADRAAVQEVQLAIAAKPDEIDLGFWRAVLGYDPMSDDNGVDPLGHGSTVWMQELDDGEAAAARDARGRVRRARAGRRRGSPQPWPPAAGSWPSRTRPSAGSCPIGPATACASPRGRTGRCRRPTRSPAPDPCHVPAVGRVSSMKPDPARDCDPWTRTPGSPNDSRPTARTCAAWPIGCSAP